MATIEKTMVTVSATIGLPVEKVWRLWTNPKHIVKWNNASPDWHTPKAENDLRVGGRFLSRMEARDGSTGFDFTGVYIRVDKHRHIAYILDDGRDVQITFETRGDETVVIETFETEHENSPELQKNGWQSILNNFKTYAETLCRFAPLHFEITINARVEIVYQAMLDAKTFSEWTSEFNPVSRFEGTWEKGARILFVGEDPDGKTGGMVARIREHIPGRFVSIEYIGIIKDGKEIMTGPEAENWAGGLENYSFSEVNRKTIVTIDVDSSQEFKTYFLETWPKALGRLKKICEEK